MTILSKLTLIVPTYNRPNFALRNMRYWSGQGVSVHVIDGSCSSINQENLDKLADNIYYHHRPVSLYERLRCVLELISTEYCALLSDDEFFLPSGVEAAITYLDQNQDFVACGGQAIGFFTSGMEIKGRLVYPEFKGYSNIQEDPLTRMYDHMANYTPSTIYSIVRSDVWKKAMRLVLRREFPVYAIPELQFELAIAFFGKSKAIDNIFWLRSFENTPIRGTDVSLLKNNKFEVFWDSPQKKHEKDELLNIMAGELGCHYGHAYQALKDSIEKALDLYRESIRKRRSSCVKLTIFQKIKKMVDQLRGVSNPKKTSVGMPLKDIIHCYNPAVVQSAINDIDEIVDYLRCWKSNDGKYNPSIPMG